MSKPKTVRNMKIAAYFKAGRSIYWIAKRFKLSWPRVKDIISKADKDIDKSII